IIHPDYEGEALEQAGSFLLNQRIPLSLSHHLQGATNLTGLRKAWSPDDTRVQESEVNICPVVTLNGHSWETYLSSLGPDHRYNFRRRLKQLNRSFTVRLELVQREEERQTALANLISLHYFRRNQLGGSEAFQGSAVRAFHDEVTTIALRCGQLR